MQIESNENEEVSPRQWISRSSSPFSPSSSITRLSLERGLDFLIVLSLIPRFS
jgi:hypothetical protein